MAKQPSNAESRDTAVPEVDLKDPRLAAFLAWLVPGLGHLYQGRTGKGLLFFVCIVGTFVYGLYIGEGRVVYAATSDMFSRQFLERWQYICQLGVGLPALPALVQTVRAENRQQPLIHDKFMRPPRLQGDFTSPDNANNTVVHPNELAQWNYELADRFEIGTVFTVIAGLLNLLVIFDAYSGPLIIVPPEKEGEDKEKGRGGEGETS